MRVVRVGIERRGAWRGARVWRAAGAGESRKSKWKYVKNNGIRVGGDVFPLRLIYTYLHEIYSGENSMSIFKLGTRMSVHSLSPLNLDRDGVDTQQQSAIHTAQLGNTQSTASLLVPVSPFAFRPPPPPPLPPHRCPNFNFSRHPPLPLPQPPPPRHFYSR